MPKRSSISIFIAATSALAISTANTDSVKSGENDLGGLKDEIELVRSSMLR